MEIFLTVWLLISAIVIIGLIFMAGYDQGSSDDIWGLIPMVLMWPLFLIAAIIVAPFYGIYRLGKWCGEKE